MIAKVVDMRTLTKANAIFVNLTGRDFTKHAFIFVKNCHGNAASDGFKCQRSCHMTLDSEGLFPVMSMRLLVQTGGSLWCCRQVFGSPLLMASFTC